MRAAAIQFFATPFQLDRNLETAERLVRQAGAQGAQLAVLPELFNTGYVYSRRLFAAAEPPDGPTLRWLRDLSAEMEMYLAGALLLREGKAIHDAFALVEPGGRVHLYRKRHPFLWERCYFEPGREPVVAQTALGRIGLLVCWDIAHAGAWADYRGQVDWLLIASAPPRLHRAVLNFPLGRKVYLSQLLPSLLRDREAIDGWYGAAVGARAAWLGAPVVHAVTVGRFVTEAPLARASLLAAALARPRYWPLIGQAHLASLRATFYGGSAIFDAQGNALAQVETEEGVAVADLTPWPPSLKERGKRAGDRPPPLSLPAQVRLLDWLMRAPARWYYWRNKGGGVKLET